MSARAVWWFCYGPFTLGYPAAVFVGYATGAYPVWFGIVGGGLITLATAGTLGRYWHREAQVFRSDI